jgi:hypothetical protein
MVFRFSAALVALAILGSPALACMGPNVLFADNFQTADPGWHGEIAVANGNANVTYPGQFNLGVAFYGAKFIDSGDACVDMVGPVSNPNNSPTNGMRGGIIFGFTDIDNFYVFQAGNDGKALVFELQNGGYLTPVAPRAAPSFQTGANATNNLRITWKGASASAYINNQPFITFKINALQNSMIGFWAANDGDTPVVYKFNNLKVTDVP